MELYSARPAPMLAIGVASAPMCGPITLHAMAAPERIAEWAIGAYAEARQLMRSGDYQQARLQLDLVERGLPRIKDHIALLHAELALLRAEPERAYRLYDEATDSQNGEIRIQALAGKLFAMIGADDRTAGEALERLLETYPDLPQAPKLKLAWAESLERQGRVKEAIHQYRHIDIDHPGGRFGSQARIQLRQLADQGVDVPPMTIAQEVDRANRLATTGPLSDAKKAVASLLEREVHLTANQRGSMNWLAGKLARREGRWAAALEYFERAKLSPLDDPLQAQRLEVRAVDAADAATAREKKQALRELRRLRSGKSHRRVSARRLNDMVRIAARAHLGEEVDKILSALLSKRNVPSSLLFSATVAAVGTGSDPLIIELFQTIAEERDRDGLAATYHLARTYERLGDTALAGAFFEEATRRSEDFGLRYYAMWSELGLRRLAGKPNAHRAEGFAEFGGQHIPKAPRPSLESLAGALDPLTREHGEAYPWFGRAEDLLRVGQAEAATAELFDGYLAWRQARGRAAARAGLESVAEGANREYEQLNAEVRAARLRLSDADRAVLSNVASSLGDLGTAVGFGDKPLKESYQRAYEWLAIPAANRYGLDPNLLLAVMRTESVYQKRIVSYAGAVGLMQIMPRTGQLIAHAIGHSDFTPADLLDPRTNLEFAAWYLASLIRRFDGHLPLAIAAYNGGPHNVRRWMQDHSENIPLDALLERIPFTQTHRYVRKVLVNYEAYRSQQGLEMQQLSASLPRAKTDPLAF